MRYKKPLSPVRYTSMSIQAYAYAGRGRSVSRALDWLRQALRDLEHAKRSMEFGDYEWACFAAQQAAEKAVKALYQKLGVEVWGHSVSRMLQALPDEVRPPDELVDKAKELDRHHIPTRYPNFHLRVPPWTTTLRRMRGGLSGMRRRSWSSASVRLFRPDYEKVVEELRRYAERAVARGARAVILIGSLARGDYTAFSDADVVVVADNVPSNPAERIRDYIDPTLSVDVQPRVYTTEELLEMAREGRRVVREVVEYGVLLAGNGELVEEARRLLSSAP